MPYDSLNERRDGQGLNRSRRTVGPCRVEKYDPLRASRRGRFDRAPRLPIDSLGFVPRLAAAPQGPSRTQLVLRVRSVVGDASSGIQVINFRSFGSCARRTPPTLSSRVWPAVNTALASFAGPSSSTVGRERTPTAQAISLRLNRNKSSR